MKNLFLIVIAILISNLAFSQNTSTVSFEGGDMYLVDINIDTQEQMKIPIGKVLSIEYDKFYKSYSIVYNYKNQGVTIMDFTYIKDSENSEEGMRIFMENESLKGTFGVIDRHLFDPNYWNFAENITGKLFFVGFEVLENEGWKSHRGLLIEGFKQK